MRNEDIPNAWGRKLLKTNTIKTFKKKWIRKLVCNKQRSINYLSKNKAIIVLMEMVQTLKMFKNIHLTLNVNENEINKM